MTTTETFRRIIATCAKVSAAGVATTDDMNMLAREGYPMWGSLIGLIGDNAHEVRESLASGELDASLFIAALHNAIGHAGEAPMTAPHIIRTITDLLTLDRDTLLMGEGWPTGIVMAQVDWVHDHAIDPTGIFPLVILLTGAELVAVRKALEEA